ncbi:molybdopterin-guanine dinucleotide biosynthesis protein A [Chryseobacterium sediminis]|uniref:Probable molybdenum cofactor guanylyltransferase n=1 Tax=Chryseobacterium sediminis TaxID=1679494 RepID=A0ABR6Q1D1_9FLAO|nr:molybdenum cofactor guanylyltransferase [Chryseobacterium sediminis]MBB6330918.1 molybdopterin-guanine dinucleotide biosynthesis protein A [Chryseobacterium sediminis]
MKAIVLAGGQSSRMGQDKALMKLGEKTVIEHVIDNLSKVFDEVYISGNHSNYPDSKGIIKDIITLKGPMGGIYSALDYCREDIFVCSCDMPFFSSELIKDILQKKEENRINVAQYKEKVYPVVGIYPYSFLDAFTKSIEKENLKMMHFLQQQNAKYIQFSGDFESQFLNINTPECFKNAEILINQLRK